VQAERYLSLDDQENETYQALIDKLEATAEAPEDILQRRELYQAIGEALQKLSPNKELPSSSATTWA